MLDRSLSMIIYIMKINSYKNQQKKEKYFENLQAILLNPNMINFSKNSIILLGLTFKEKKNQNVFTTLGT